MITLSTETLLFVLIGITILLIGWIVRMELRLNKILRGKSGKDLEDSIHDIDSHVRDLRTFQRESIAYMKNVESRLKRSLQAIETIRFNPFKGTGSGGNQSFATAFLNEKGDGCIVSSLYSREQTRVYAKPLKKYVSEFELSEEEKEAIKTAKESLAYQNQNDR